MVLVNGKPKKHPCDSTTKQEFALAECVLLLLIVLRRKEMIQKVCLRPIKRLDHI